MNLQLVPYVAPLVLAALVSAALIAVAVPHRTVPGIRWFMVFMGCLLLWSLGYAAELVAPDLAAKVVAAQVQYLVTTNDAHGLVWASVGLTSGAAYTVLNLGHGPWFWVQVAFS